MHALNRIVTQYLDHAEDQAERRRPMRMADWRERPDAFLQFNEREVPEDTGRVSHEVAKRLAETEFDAYEAERRRLGATEPTSDFDRFVEETKQLSKGR
ncbi:MAG TPA: hydroxyacid dehydrogenase, partial [Armatimonadetes bacterium]|nr:hydroxyacid dehydrogenase [Armatimonadota bacterium]